MVPCKVNSILDLIGATPLVRINRMNPVAGVELLVKLELMNPGGSVKDRIGLRMIEQAEASRRADARQDRPGGQQRQHGHRPGHGLRVKGYPLLVTMSESASEERKRILRAYGAQILLTPGYRGTDGAIEEAYRLAREEPDKYVLVDQFNNEANWRAHYDGTGKEIWQATGGKVDVVVLTMGTTGTLMGITRALRRAQSGRPRRRRRAVQGAQDPGPQKHEGELPARASSSRRSCGRSSTWTTTRPTRWPAGWPRKRASSSA